MPNGADDIPVNLGEISIAWHMDADKASDYLVNKGTSSDLSNADLAFKSLTKSFTLTGFDAQSGVTGAVKDLIEDAIKDGKSIEDIIRERKNEEGISQYIDAKGRYRLVSLVRHHVQEAYNAGRYYQQMKNKDTRPYYRLDAVLDKRTSNVCAGANGHIYKFDNIGDPYPPLHYGGCRTRATALTEAQAGRLVSSDSPFVPQDGFGLRPDQKGENRGSIAALQNAMNILEKQGPMEYVPKRGRPTKEEVAEFDLCWLFDSEENKWRAYSGQGVREVLTDAKYTHWLPHDAIPNMNIEPGLDDILPSDDMDPDGRWR